MTEFLTVLLCKCPTVFPLFLSVLWISTDVPLIIWEMPAQLQAKESDMFSSSSEEQHILTDLFIFIWTLVEHLILRWTLSISRQLFIYSAVLCSRTDPQCSSCMQLWMSVCSLKQCIPVSPPIHQDEVYIYIMYKAQLQGWAKDQVKPRINYAKYFRTVL